MHDPSEVTILLRTRSDGDGAALDKLAERVYSELHDMARRYMKNEHPGNSLQATALVHQFAGVRLARELSHPSGREA